jgi:hypothetical protein
VSKKLEKSGDNNLNYDIIVPGIDNLGSATGYHPAKLCIEEKTESFFSF